MKEFDDSRTEIIKQKAETLKWLLRKEMTKKVEEIAKKAEERKKRWSRQTKDMLIEGKTKGKLDVALIHYGVMKMAEDYKNGKICKEVLNRIVRGMLLSILKCGIEVQ